MMSACRKYRSSPRRFKSLRIYKPAITSPPLPPDVAHQFVSRGEAGRFQFNRVIFPRMPEVISETQEDNQRDRIQIHQSFHLDSARPIPLSKDYVTCQSACSSEVRESDSISR